MQGGRRGRWRLRSVTNAEMLARVLAGVMSGSMRSKTSSIRPSAKLMPDPYTVTQMETAARPLRTRPRAGEKVAIFAIYDVDGRPRGAARWHLRHCGLDPLIHIPDRIFEGYGLMSRRCEGLRKGATLLVHGRLRHHQHRAAAESESSVCPSSSSTITRPATTTGGRCAGVNPNRPDDLSGSASRSRRSRAGSRW